MGRTGSAKSWWPNFLQRSKVQEDPSGNTHVNESSSLLPKLRNTARDEERNVDGGTGGQDRDEKSPTKQILHEFSVLSKGSIPVILAYALQNSLQTISVVIVGRRSPEDLATAAFSYMLAMCTGWLIALGGSTALDTLCSSTFTGSKDPHGLGVLLQRAFIVLSLFYVPVAILWIFSEPVFRALGQDTQLSRDSAKFLQWLIPGGFGYIYFECMKKFLQAQGLITMVPGWNGMLITYRDHPTGDVCAVNYLAD